MSQQDTRRIGRLRRRGQRGAVSSLVAGGSTVAAVALVGGGVFAASQLGGGGQQPDDVLPDSTVAYARIDLDPSASQKVDLLRLLQRFPDFAEATGISSDREDLRRALAEAVLADAGCQVDYDEDIEPWIGDRAALAGIPGSEGAEPDAVAVLQVTDASAARDGLAKLADCASRDSDAAGGFAFAGDYVVIAKTSQVADSVVSGAEAAPLSQAEQYTQDMEYMGDPGFASFWVDVRAVLEASQQAGADFADMGLASAGLAQTESVYGSVRAGSDNIELAVMTSGEQVLQNGSSPIGELPESTLVGFSISGLGEALTEQWDKVRDTFEQIEPGAFDREVTAFERDTGLQLPEDLATLLGENVTLAVDSGGLDPATRDGEGFTPASINAGVRFTGDPQAIRDVLGRVQTALPKGAPFSVVTAELDDGVVMATNDGYAAKMTGGGLSAVGAFTEAVGEGEDSAAVFYLDLDRAAAIAEPFAEPSGADPSVSDYLRPVRALGMATTVEDGHSETVFRLTFDEGDE